MMNDAMMTIPEYKTQSEAMAAFNIASVVIVGDEDGLKVYEAVKGDPMEMEYLITGLTKQANELREWRIDPDFGGVFLFGDVCREYGMDPGTLIKPTIMADNLMEAVEILKALKTIQ